MNSKYISSPKILLVEKNKLIDFVVLCVLCVCFFFENDVFISEKEDRNGSRLLLIRAPISCLYSFLTHM